MIDAEALFEGAACGLLLTDKAGLIWRVNHTFCSWIGYSSEELVGVRRLQDLMNMGGKIFHQTHWAPLMKLQGSVSEVKLDLIRKDGVPLPFIMNGASRQVGDCTVHDVAAFIARDRHKYELELLRERKRAEQLLTQQLEAQSALSLAEARLRVALDAAQLYVWQVDPATGERQYDEGIGILLGFGKPAKVTAAEFSSFIHPADRLDEENAFALALNNGTSYRAVYRIKSLTGDTRTVLATGSGRADQNGALVSFVGVIQDISELSRQRAEAEDRAIFAEQMVGIVSHDLRNPLSAVKMGAELLGKQAQDERQQRILAHISDATSRAQRMIDDLLDFTLIRLGRGLTVKLRPVDCCELISASVSELRLAYRGREIIHYHDGERLCKLDADRIFQVTGNLVSNALTYGDPSSKVEVFTRIGSGLFTLSVHNEGKPIPPGLLPSLFEPMARGVSDGSSARSVGLGLFIVKEISRSHGGDVHVDSTEQTGTTFTVSLPLHHVA